MEGSFRLIMLYGLLGFGSSIVVECPLDLPCECAVVDEHSAPEEGQQTIEINCSNKGLTEPPDWTILHGMPVTHIDLSHNNIRVLNNGAFAGVKFWKHTPSVWTSRIDVNHNPLVEIKPDAFKDMHGEAIMVHIEKTHLDEIPVRAFEKIVNLTDFFFRFNPMTNLPGGLFVNCKKLRRIDLSGNRVGSLHEDTFLGLETSLKSLYLNHMDLSAFPGTALSRLQVLWELKLNHNQITKLPNDIFQGMQATSQRFAIHMQHNGLHDIALKAFARSKLLVYSLYLENNKITNTSWLVEPCTLSFAPYAHVNLKDNPNECDCTLFSILKSGYYDVFGECVTPKDMYKIPWISQEYNAKAKRICYGDMVTMWELSCLSGSDADHVTSASLIVVFVTVFFASTLVMKTARL